MKKYFKTYLLSFLIPITILTIVFFILGFYPFGNKTLLTIDMDGQYVSYFNYFIKGRNIFYSFSKGLGGNMFGLFTYYLASPLNIILFLFNEKTLPLGILILSSIKIGLSGLTTSIFLSKKFNKQEWTTILFAVSYALMSYNFVYMQNIMWLDGVILLPLIFLSIDKKNNTLFFITLTLALMTNFYIGYMITIGSIIYYLYNYIISNNFTYNIKKDLKENLKFFKYIILAVLTASIILIPSFLALIAGKGNPNIQEFALSQSKFKDFIPVQSFSFLDILSMFYIGRFNIKNLEYGPPNIFVGVLSLILITLYFINKNIKTKEKKLTGVLLLIFMISFIFSPLNVMWHMFQRPIGFSFRYAFIFSLILIIISYKSYLKLSLNNKDTLLCTLFLITVSLFFDSTKYVPSIVFKYLGSLIVMLIYIWLLNKKQIFKKFIIFLVSIELALNGVITLYSFKYTKFNKYQNINNNLKETINEIKTNDNGIYRIEKNINYNLNDPMTFNYNGISHFSSLFDMDIFSVLGENFGLMQRFYMANYNGRTPVTDLLFNVKYLVSNNTIRNYTLINTKKYIDYKNDDTLNNMYIYQNSYKTNIGYLVNKNIKDLTLLPLEPFINQNNIINTMINSSDEIFKGNKLTITDEVNLTKEKKDTTMHYKKSNLDKEGYINLTIVPENDGILYFYIGSFNKKNIDVIVNNKSIIDLKDENDYNYNILELGYHEKNKPINIKIEALEKDIYVEKIMSYTLDEEAFQKAATKFESNLNIEIFKDTYIKGHIDNKEDKLLYLSIPYSKYLDIYINSKKTDKLKIIGNFIGVEIPNGNHTIEIKYNYNDIVLGSLGSIIGIVLFILTLKKNKEGVS